MPSHINANNEVSAPLHGLLERMAAFEREQGRAPLVAELLQSETAIAPAPTTRSRLHVLIARELVRIQGEGHRQFVALTEGGFEAAKWGKIPTPLKRFDGGAHAGPNGSSMDALERDVRCLSDLLPTNGENEMFYILPVRGDCMAGGKRPIWPGDELFFERRSRCNRPANGRVAHVERRLSSGETETLIREYWFDEETGMVTLKPRNPMYAQEVLPDDEVEPRGEMRRHLQSDDDASELLASAPSQPHERRLAPLRAVGSRSRKAPEKTATPRPGNGTKGRGVTRKVA